VSNYILFDFDDGGTHIIIFQSEERLRQHLDEGIEGIKPECIPKYLTDEQFRNLAKCGEVYGGKVIIKGDVFTPKPVEVAIKYSFEE
jgi:hypothetical protein